ncbi:MAG: hypothetical protein HKN68_00930 [Saprospiraceae bacterium]|nr:hypothetical protein [Saprospiraceae bacterium]
MKKILLIIISGFMIFTSCKDESKAPIITFDQAGKGAYVRLVNTNEGVNGFNLSQFSTSAFDFDVEFVDEQQGDLVSTYTIYASYTPSPFSSTPASAEILYLTQDSGTFTESDRGYKGTNVRIPLADIASKLGLSEGDLGGADVFNFRSEIVLQDGSVFQFSNSTSAVNGSAFQGHFNFAVKLSCPLDDDSFIGDYTLTHVSGEYPFGLFTFNGTESSTVNLTKVTGTKRKFVYKWQNGVLGSDSPDVDFVFDIVCTIVVPDDNQGTSIGCGGTITLGSQNGAFGTVDVEDDSSLVIDLNEWVDDGGCGVPVIPIQVRLDKN